MAEYKEPEHIKHYHKKRELMEKTIATHKLEHSEAYNKAAREHLLDEAGRVDYKKLDDSKVQEDFVKKMVDHYMISAKKAFGDIKPRDEMSEEIILKAYAGVTKAEMLDTIRRHGKRYTLDAHKARVDEIVEHLEKQLGPVTYSHFKPEHAEDVLKHTKAYEAVDKEKIRPEEVGGTLGALLDLHKQSGIVTSDMLEKTPLKHILKKKKK